MSKKDQLDLILRRIQVERRKGSSIEEMYEIITKMIRNQKIADDNFERSNLFVGRD